MTAEQFDYLDAIERALTPKVWAYVRAFAKKRCDMLRNVGMRADPDELTMDAVSDTTLGERLWERDKYELRIHLCGVISSRTSHMMDRGLRVRSMRLDAAALANSESLDAEVSATAPPDDPATLTERSDRLHRTMTALFALAEGQNDRQAMAILHALADGLTERHEIAAHLGISVKKYDHARKRLLRLVDKLPDDLRSPEGAP